MGRKKKSKIVEDFEGSEPEEFEPESEPEKVEPPKESFFKKQPKENPLVKKILSIIEIYAGSGQKVTAVRLGSQQLISLEGEELPVEVIEAKQESLIQFVV